MDEMLTRVAIMSFSALFGLLAFLIVVRIKRQKKLKKHMEEWERRKTECINKIDPIIWSFHPHDARLAVVNEYNDYIKELFTTELNTITGCCFPPLGKIARKDDEK